ncbi:MAG TPA: TonB-dependent receptor [Thermoanaerobaculia bacterium]|nr:TonB-dependent receptor [Thermoanaerobaculia bacterium]
MILILSAGGAAFAQVTGSISGTVRGSDDAALPGVTVTVSGPLLPAGRTAVTDDNGAFTILRLPPGDYEVVADLQGLGNVKRGAVVALERDTQVNLVLNPSVTGELTVTTVLPTIDVKSSDVQTNYTTEQIENLPVGRTYRGLFQLAPGVSENGRNTPNAGASRMENTYMVDGINVTNPHYGDILPDITELDIAEVSLKRGGISAEYGRAAGMVVNAITKSGTNDFAGQLRTEYQPASFVSDSKLSTIQSTRDRSLFAGALGGPILRDHLWFYGSVNLPTVTSTDRVNNLGGVPDEDRSTDEYFGKLTSNPGASHFLSLSGRKRDTTTENSIGASTFSVSSPSVATDDSTDYLLGTFSWVWNVTSDSLTELKLNHNEEKNSAIPVNDLGYRPAFNALRPDLVGRFSTATGIIVGGANAAGQIVGGSDLFNFQDFERDEARLTYQRFGSWGDTRHDIRGGVTYDHNEEQLSRQANGWGNISFSTTTRTFTANYVSIQPPHTGRADVWGAFLQDQISVGERMTVTAGLLVNRDEYFGEGLGATPGTKTKVKILTFDWDQQIQPRLGITFVPSPQLGDKVYANFGRYSNTENKSLTRAASPTRIFTTRATFDANGTLISEVPAANTQNKKIDAGLDPMFTDEYLAGYARPLGSAWSAEVWGMYREVGDIFEDVSADGLGNGPFRVSQLPDAFRKYTAATLELNRRPADDRFKRLWINASYTWSRLEGNWDIDYADQLFFNSSILQDGPGVLITDNRDGLLRGNRTHLAKLFATIEPIEHLRAGTYIRYQSGAAWEARAQPSTNVSSSYHRYLEAAGSRRMEDWLNVDLLTSYEFRFGDFGLEVEGRVTNLFDEQVALQVDDRYLLNQPLNPSNPGPNPLLSPSNNANFGKPTQLSDPRAIVLSAILRFR